MSADPHVQPETSTPGTRATASRRDLLNPHTQPGRDAVDAGDTITLAQYGGGKATWRRVGGGTGLEAMFVLEREAT